MDMHCADRTLLAFDLFQKLIKKAFFRYGHLVLVKTFIAYIFLKKCILQNKITRMSKRILDCSDSPLIGLLLFLVRKKLALFQFSACFFL